MKCHACSSKNVFKFNSFKHHCYSCNDCNSISHVKKKKYFTEYFLPKKLMQKILPRQAFLRLLPDPGEGALREDFYDVYKDESENPAFWRFSQFNQLMDQLEKSNIDISNKAVLDISGGPGIVAHQLKDKCKKVVVTEFSIESVNAMKANLNVDSVKFDYATDDLNKIFNEKFDVILLRSSIIFCSDIKKLFVQLNKLLNEDGVIICETIIPSLGEVFWWQQMEFKFPTIYSQEFIEKCFYMSGFNLKYGYKETGDYIGIKNRGTKGFAKRLYTFTIDLGFMYFYYFFSRKSKISIDSSSRHKFLTGVWQKRFSVDAVNDVVYEEYESNDSNQSPHFAYTYNGYLKNN